MLIERNFIIKVDQSKLICQNGITLFWVKTEGNQTGRGYSTYQPYFPELERVWEDLTPPQYKVFGPFHMHHRVTKDNQASKSPQLQVLKVTYTNHL